MASDYFKKKRGKIPERKKEQRTPRPNSFLIVSEGTKTEPLYFDGLAAYINQKFGQSIDSQKPIITPEGIGRGTVKLVEAAKDLVSREKIMYSQVWVIFDKDDFQDFDEAIDTAEKCGFHVGWSNRAFEYWIFLHYGYSDAALDDWEAKIDEIFKKNGIDPNGYQKNNPRVFEITKSKLKQAVKNAAKIEAAYDDKAKPSSCDPCTKVHHLIQELAPYLEELL